MSRDKWNQVIEQIDDRYLEEADEAALKRLGRLRRERRRKVRTVFAMAAICLIIVFAADKSGLLVYRQEGILPTESGEEIPGEEDGDGTGAADDRTDAPDDETGAAGDETDSSGKETDSSGGQTGASNPSSGDSHFNSNGITEEGVGAEGDLSVNTGQLTVSASAAGSSESMEELEDLIITDQEKAKQVQELVLQILDSGSWDLKWNSGSAGSEAPEGEPDLKVVIRQEDGGTMKIEIWGDRVCVNREGFMTMDQQGMKLIDSLKAELGIE